MPQAAPRPPRFVTPTKGPVESSFRRVNPERWECHSLTDEMYGLSMINILILSVHIAFHAFCFVFANLFSMFDYNSATCHSFDQCVCVCGMILVDRFDWYIIWCYILLSSARSFYFDSSYKKSFGSPHETAASRSTKLFFEIARDHQDFPCRMDSSPILCGKIGLILRNGMASVGSSEFLLTRWVFVLFFPLRSFFSLMPLFHTFLWNSENVSNR